MLVNITNVNVIFEAPWQAKLVYTFILIVNWVLTKISKRMIVFIDQLVQINKQTPENLYCMGWKNRRGVTKTQPAIRTRKGATKAGEWTQIQCEGMHTSWLTNSSPRITSELVVLHALRELPRQIRLKRCSYWPADRSTMSLYWIVRLGTHICCRTLRGDNDRIREQIMSVQRYLSISLFLN
jgi:hypothetical protein